MVFLLLMKFLVSFGICSTPKLQNYVALPPFTYKAIQWVPIDLYWSKLITSDPSFILNIYWITLNLGLLWYYLWISKLVKVWGRIKNPGLL